MSGANHTSIFIDTTSSDSRFFWGAGPGHAPTNTQKGFDSQIAGITLLSLEKIRLEKMVRTAPERRNK